MIYNCRWRIAYKIVRVQEISSTNYTHPCPTYASKKAITYYVRQRPLYTFPYESNKGTNEIENEGLLPTCSLLVSLAPDRKGETKCWDKSATCEAGEKIERIIDLHQFVKGKATNPILLAKSDGIQLDVNETRLDWQENIHEFNMERWKKGLP